MPLSAAKIIIIPNAAMHGWLSSWIMSDLLRCKKDTLNGIILAAPKRGTNQPPSKM
jgi:hypothetical protein